jgi:hypothetical protein
MAESTRIQKDIVSQLSDSTNTLLRGDSHDSTLRYALNDEAVEKAKAQACGFFSRIDAFVKDDKTWLLEGSTPTALDAHCVTYIARLAEAGNSNLIPARLQEYAKLAMARPEWQSVTEGKPTLWNVYLRDHLIPAMQK